jgi:hypothetical protein
MAWSGSAILYLINEEILCPEEGFGGRKSSGPFRRYASGLSRFGVEDQAGRTLIGYARGLHRSSRKRSC